mmetsp:Transcript_41692/g.118331  ORF Transcript_41692/g.118331 Transcript_41692/m.118331 type:complete len:293 (-) Transcript_41692:959-1837(-)
MRSRACLLLFLPLTASCFSLMKTHPHWRESTKPPRLQQTHTRPRAMIPPQVVTSLGVNSGLAGVLAAIKQDVLTSAGLFNAYLLGVCLWSTLGWQGWCSGVLYLVGGSAATKLKKREKEKMGIAEKRGGAREPAQVWGSAATAAFLATLTIPLQGDQAIIDLLKLGVVASFATKLSDTCASEIGKGFGRNTYLATTFTSVPPGTEGAVSLEGTLAGIFGSFVQAAFGAAAGLITVKAIPVCMLAAFLANYVESIIGATAQDKVPWLNNEMVNLLNTAIGAAIAMAIMSFTNK